MLKSPWLWAIIFACLSITIDAQAQPKSKGYPTYFEYSQEEHSKLANTSSKLQMTKEQLYNWDKILEELIRKYPPKDGESNRIVAYLYTAQRDAAFLSYNAHGNFLGSFDPVSKEIISLFFKNPQLQLPNVETDDYSQYLAQIVASQLIKRLKEENEDMKELSIEEGSTRWKPDGAAYGLQICSWKPWLIPSTNQFKIPAPPEADSDFWKKEIASVKEAQKDLTEQKKQAILFWNGNKGPGSGAWDVLMNNFLFSRNIPLEKMVLVRSVFAEAYCDTNIIIFDAKYKYLVRRPSMMDNSISTFIKVPNHPSYPSGHSTTSGMTAALLSYYFPDATSYWYGLAEEAGLSRIWAGIHFPIDHQVGFAMGQNIAKSITEMPKNNL